MTTGYGNTGGVAYSYRLMTHTSHRASFQWTLNRVFTDAVFNVLTSPIFVVGDRAWVVQLYPDGRRHSDAGFMSIFLKHVDGPNADVQFTFAVKSRDGDRMTLGSDAFYDHSAWGYQKFVHRGFLMDPQERFYENQQLDLEIEVDIQLPNQQERMVSDLAHALQNGCNLEGKTEPSSSQEECVVCLANSVTSGFMHGFTCHKCVCEECALRYIENSNGQCPVCREKIDQVILKFF